MEDQNTGVEPVSPSDPGAPAGGLSQSEDPIALSAETVRRLAGELFDSTQVLHGLSESSRNILEKAALLYNRPVSTKKKKPFRAVLSSVKSGLGQDFTAEAQKTLAVVIAIQHKLIKRKDLAHLDLSAVQEREALTLAAILRIAIGLNTSGNQQTKICKVNAARDGVWIVVDGPDVMEDAAAARHNARMWEKIGYPELHVMQPAKAAIKLLPFPEPTEQIGILPVDAMAEAGRKAMLFNFARMLQHEEGARLGVDIEAVHDMRVATRRLRAAFDVFKDAFEPEIMKPHLSGLRKTGRLLGAVRDLDVFMEKGQRYMDTLSEGERGGMDALLSAWQAQRENARTRLIAHLDSREYATFKRKFNHFLQTPGAGARPLPKHLLVPYQVRELAPVLIYTRLAAARAFDPFPVDAPIEHYHALRIELKKFRYTVEYFQEVLGKRAREVVDALKQMQDHLGDLNDAQVAEGILSEFIDTWKKHPSEQASGEPQDLQPIVAYLAYVQAQRSELMVTFHPAWKHFSRPTFRHGLAQAISVL